MSYQNTFIPDYGTLFNDMSSYLGRYVTLVWSAMIIVYYHAVGTWVLRVCRLKKLDLDGRYTVRRYPLLATSYWMLVHTWCYSDTLHR